MIKSEQWCILGLCGNCEAQKNKYGGYYEKKKTWTNIVSYNDNMHDTWNAAYGYDGWCYKSFSC